MQSHGAGGAHQESQEKETTKDWGSSQRGGELGTGGTKEGAGTVELEEKQRV